MRWDKSELNELTKQICEELRGVGFGITDWELMEGFVREGLKKFFIILSSNEINLQVYLNLLLLNILLSLVLCHRC